MWVIMVMTEDKKHVGITSEKNNEKNMKKMGKRYWQKGGGVVYCASCRTERVEKIRTYARWQAKNFFRKDEKRVLTKEQVRGIMRKLLDERVERIRTWANRQAKKLFLKKWKKVLTNEKLRDILRKLSDGAGRKKDLWRGGADIENWTTIRQFCVLSFELRFEERYRKFSKIP